ncbi:NinF family protein [Salmonella enterica subsp. enterica serovar Agona]|uniref:NinF family protein n=3 Tax=Salmonella enterica I TaxID=59201 RepID=A0A3Y1Q797_SALET|nr:protein NinF [Salmonella enterica]EAV3182530.1 NinF family protein [Salmonella enterica subsp. enterica]EBB4918725.1 NinF family protein [Salmonella enterica subsp. enterica serovar Enteritidis]EBZ1695166.1 NinF family protein [Salmonella enterica subsp. enterica serovar Bredeney]ECA9004322.1 NinF family protein [Salmonella enterica subsp. enterica serovar Anatum]ECG5876249.1 NinF family protein [Salmonella enterica subsp. enterica serovar Typhi str. CFSAN000628]ECK9490439.1 NinF family pr
MIDPNRSYEQESIARAMCAGCNKQLAPGEIYVCAECVNEWLVYRDPNGDMTEEDDERCIK